jgi:hypothetical protein
MDNTVKYLLNNYSNLLTEDEWRIKIYLMMIEKFNKNDHNTSKYGEFISRLPKELVNKYLNDGVDSFYSRIKERLLSEEKEKIYLNYCQKCGKLPVSPKSKQCLSCGFDWH